MLACFTRHRVKRLPTLTIFDELPYAHADVVRAFEDLEKQGGLLIRRTEQGSDWVFLTQSGAIAAGVADAVDEREPSRCCDVESQRRNARKERASNSRFETRDCNAAAIPRNCSRIATVATRRMNSRISSSAPS